MSKVVLEAKGICKSFGSVQALKNVDFVLHAGEIHGLIGENGSGKSTLSSIIAGVQPATSGEMSLNGNTYSPADALKANEEGVYMLLQERGTFSDIRVSANIFAGKESDFSKMGVLNTRKMYACGRQALDRIGAEHIDERAITGSLTFEDQKMVEIARAMNGNPEILIVDETTTALSRQGREILYKQIYQMRDEGKSIIFISHDIDEVKEVCDTLTVLRDGSKIETLDKADFTDQRIRSLMVGRDIGDNFYREDTHATSQDEVAIRADHVNYGILNDVSIELHKGEILGIGGLTDCGMHDLGKLLFGIYKPDSGQIICSDKQIKNTRDSVKKKIAYVAKDRDTEALMVAGNILDNICAPSLKKLQKGCFIFKRNEKKFSNEWAGKLDVKMTDVNQIVNQLSGGNKQKVSIAKWLGFDADIFIFDCPTRGIDIGVKASIYRLLEELKAQGKAILMISEELMEVIGMSDRVVIIKDGVITGQFLRDEGLTENKLIEYII